MNPTSFAIETRVRGDVCVIAVRGELDLHTAPQLEESVDGVLEAGDGPLAIDLSACEFIDSTGIALIVRACRQLNGSCDGGADGRFALSGLSDQVQRLFDITGLESLIPLHATVDEAVAALSQ
jgi:anti-sigma B factor antagonist